MEFDFIWVEGRETNESYEWFKKVDFVNILSSMYYSFTSISCLSGLPSVTYGLKIFIYFIYFFLFLNIQPLRCSKVGRKRQNNSWEFWDISCGFCPHIDKWQTPLLSVFCTWEIRKKGFSFNNERRIIWYFREFYLGKLLSGVIYTPPFKM